MLVQLLTTQDLLRGQLGEVKPRSAAGVGRDWDWRSGPPQGDGHPAHKQRPAEEVEREPVLCPP